MLPGYLLSCSACFSLWHVTCRSTTRRYRQFHQSATANQYGVRLRNCAEANQSNGCRGGVMTKLHDRDKARMAPSAACRQRAQTGCRRICAASCVVAWSATSSVRCSMSKLRTCRPSGRFGSPRFARPTVLRRLCASSVANDSAARTAAAPSLPTKWKRSRPTSIRELIVRSVFVILIEQLGAPAEMGGPSRLAIR